MRRIVALFLVFSLFGCAHARVRHRDGRSAESASATLELLPGQQAWLRVGEKLEYAVSWWGIYVGTAELSVLPTHELGCVALVCQARSNPYLEAFYPVRVTLTSFFNTADRAPVRFEANVRRRWRKHQSTVTFDRVKSTAFHQLPKKKSATVVISPETQDGISLLYYARSIPFRVGKTIPFQITADGKNWDILGRITDIDVVKVRIGEFEAHEGTIELAYPVPFFQGARARVWIDSGPERIPLLTKINSRIGPVSVVLTKRSIDPEPPPWDPSESEIPK